MRFLLHLVVLTALLTPAYAQDFPDPGEGAFSWGTLGSERVGAAEIIFTDDGTPVAIHSDIVRRYNAVTDAWSYLRIDNQVGSADSVLPLRGDTLIAGAYVARSLDGGTTWEYPCGFGSNVTCDRQWENGSENIAEVTVGPYAGRLLAGGVLYSDDRGASWSTATVHANETNWGVQIRAFAPLPSGRALGAGTWGVVYSDTGGEDWTPTDLFEPYQREGFGIQPWATPGSIQAHDAGGPAPSCGLADPLLCEGAVAVGIGGATQVRTWWTNDGGRTWTPGGLLPQIFDTPGASRVAMLREIDRAGTSSDGAGAGRGLAILAAGFVYRTVDGGVTWDVVARAPSIGPEPEDGGIMLAAEIGPDGRIYTVQIQSEQDEYVWVTEEPASSAFAYVVSDEAGPSASPEVGVTVRPNPSAAGTVTVEVGQASPSALRVEVYDAVGRRVAVLHEGAARAELSLTVDTSRWAPGVYTVRVTGGGAVTAEPFTVVR